jgi:Protein of unknown function (DUF3047).
MKTERLSFIFLYLAIFVLGLCGTTLFAGDDKVIVAKFASDRMEKGVPLGWELKKYKGTPVVRLEKVGDKFCLHMISDTESSFGIRKEFKINVEEYPFLNWRWKAVKLPVGGDVRKTDTDDQAIQIYVAFTAIGWPKRLNTPVVGYIWDNEAPRELMVASSQPLCGKIRYVVVRNKEDKPGEWYTEKRNFYEDYKKLFKDIEEDQLPVTTAGVQFSINSQNTGSEGESYICDVYFSKD